MYLVLVHVKLKTKLRAFLLQRCDRRQYVNFNSVGKAIDKQLEILGATRVYERGEGDDDQNIEEDFEQWKENGLWPALRKALGKEESQGKEDAWKKRENCFLLDIRFVSCDGLLVDSGDSIPHVSFWLSQTDCVSLRRAWRVQKLLWVVSHCRWKWVKVSEICQLIPWSR